RVVILTTGWQTDDSQLALSSKFVPMLSSLLDLSGVTEIKPAQYFVGDPGLPANATTPGLYSADGQSGARFAINLDPAESRTAPMAPDELERFGAPVAAAAKLDPVREAARKAVLQGVDAENRQKLWRWFIVATLAVLLI